MATVEEVKVTGRKYRIWDEVNSIWKRISYWTKACDVEFDDELNLEDKVDEINDSIDAVDDRLTQVNTSLTNQINELNRTFSSALTALKNTAIARAVGATGTTFTSVIATLAQIPIRYNTAKAIVPGQTETLLPGYYTSNHSISVAAETGTYGPVTVNGTFDMGATNTYRYVNVNVQTAPQALSNLQRGTTARPETRVDCGYFPAVVGKTYIVLTNYAHGFWSDDEPAGWHSNPYVQSGATTLYEYVQVNTSIHANQQHDTKASVLIVRATDTTVCIRWCDTPWYGILD